jgi:hypothetical protein
LLNYSMNNMFYARTIEGQAAAYDATSAMPRKLKSLLKVIDGKTSLEVFSNSLKAFGDVQGLLVSLQKAGLIEIRQDSAEGLASAAAHVAEPRSAFASEGGLMSGLASKMGLRQDRTRAPADGFALTQAIPTQPATVLEQRSSSAQSNQERQQDLQLLVQDMSSFVLAYVPEQAFSVLSELEQITTVEQMAVLLGGYELMVRHVGEPAQIHLLHVRQTLSQWL